MKKFLVGNKISLHGLSPQELRADAPYYGWLDNLELDLFGERSDFPNNPQRMASYYETACANDRLVLLGIFDNATDRHIGNITLQQIDWIHRRAFLGYLVGESDFAGKGVATEAVLMMMYYGFNKLNFERIWTTIAASHTASVRVAEKVGLKQEGCLRGHQLRNGARRDLLLVGALRDEWTSEVGSRASALFSSRPV